MENEYNPEVRRFRTLDDLNRNAAELLAAIADTCVRDRGMFTLTLAGGNTPRSLYEHISSDRHRDMLPWRNTHLFWGDERCVPPDHKDSNYHMAKKSLLCSLDLPADNIHRIYGNNPSPIDAASDYENDIRSFYCTRTNVPVMDVIMLGIGSDGHTASLFPGDTVLGEKRKLVAAVTAPSYMSPARRITMTLPLINHAAHVLFFAAGKEKQVIIDRLLRVPDEEPPLPAALVRPKGRLYWFVADK